MIKAVVFDFGRVFVFPKDESYFGSLSDLHRVMSEFPKYNFNNTFEFNQELIDFIKSEQVDLKFKLYLFTRGSLHKTGESRKFLNGFFKDIYTCEKLKVKKSEPKAYSLLAEKIGLDPSCILYVDDARDNTSAAEAAGFQTITFRNNMQFEAEMVGYSKGILKWQ